MKHIKKLFLFTCTTLCVLTSYGQERELVLSSGVFNSKHLLTLSFDSQNGFEYYQNDSLLFYSLTPSIRMHKNGYFKEFGLRRLSVNNSTTAVGTINRFLADGLRNVNFELKIKNYSFETFYGINKSVFRRDNLKFCIGLESFISLYGVRFKIENDTTFHYFSRIKWFDQILTTNFGFNITPRILYQKGFLSFDFFLINRFSVIERNSYFDNFRKPIPSNTNFFNHITFSPQLSIGINLNYFTNEKT